MKRDLLIDTSYFVAMYHKYDQYHEFVKRFRVPRNAILYVPDAVLPEVCYFLDTRVNYQTRLAFMDSLQKPYYTLLPTPKPIIARAHAIGAEYADNELNFTDCCIMALAEQEQISQICTFDRRDFSTYRPAHVEAFTLLS